MKTRWFHLAAVFVALSAIAVPGCGANKCKTGTLYLNLELNGAAAAASSVEFELSVDGGTPKTQVLSHDADVQFGTIEIQFPGG